jgi:hypothetical protein
MTADPIADLRDLLAAATPGPWIVGVFHGCIFGPNYVAVADTVDGHVADAAIIVAAINALPALLDIAEAARAYLDTSPAQTGRVSEERLRVALARLDGTPT